MKRSDYLRECSRLSRVMADKNQNLAVFYSTNPDFPISTFEELEELHAELTKAIGEWQSFCNLHKWRLTD